MTNEMCASCGKTADIEITPSFRPLTVHGEQACVAVEKSGLQKGFMCIDCLLKAGFRSETLQTKRMGSH
jgi:hypothetical protein